MESIEVPTRGGGKNLFEEKVATKLRSTGQ